MLFRAVLVPAAVLFTLSPWPSVAAGQSGKDDTAQIEFFEVRIRPLLVKHCYSCHSREAKKLRGELLLDTRDGLRKGGATGPALIPGQPDESLLIRAVRHEGELRMPPKAKLTEQEIADLIAWVKMGAPDPRTAPLLSRESLASAEPALAKDSRLNKPKLWSLQPLAQPTPPRVKDTAWPLTAVDRYILARLEAKGLKPVELADRRTLLRRATYDLTGLPPTPEEIEDFLRDDRPDAFARVVERLLASPAYGERWGRYWLDVVRYADTAGDNSDYPVPDLYRYRDWVIAAFNRDMPYDQFVREQLAGDLMPAASEADRRDKLIATGYLANAHRYGSYGDDRYPWHLTIEDTIDNLGKTFLGLTINCCRCHDHKFDPLTAEDYYGLYGFFSSTRYPWPGAELERAPHDLVPLVPPDEADRLMKDRQQKFAGRDTAIRLLEAERAGLEKALRAAAEEEKETLRKQFQVADQKLQAARKERDKLAQEPLLCETAYAVVDGRNEPKKRIGQVGNVRLHLKGDPERLGKEVPRRFPVVLGGQTLSPEVQGSGRLELACWLTDAANPLTARVLVNRLWHYHFGRGLVATPNNFGKQGQLSSHPELLDDLARRFIASGWSIKAMHRLIMNSRVYQLSSRDEEANQLADAGNELLWHHARRRLDAEAIRDAILAISGGLDRSPSGPHPFPDPRTWSFTQHRPFKAVYESNHRSVYLMTQRIQRHPFLALFDGPDTNASTPTRTTSTTSLQALYLMNSPFVHEQAQKLAVRLLAEQTDNADRVERVFLLLYGRPPADEEREQARHYLAQIAEGLRTTGVPDAQIPLRAWESLARGLFLSSEFVYLN